MVDLFGIIKITGNIILRKQHFPRKLDATRKIRLKERKIKRPIVENMDLRGFYPAQNN